MPTVSGRNAFNLSFADLASNNPNGIVAIAQGCVERATLGDAVKRNTTPKRVAALFPCDITSGGLGEKDDNLID